MPKNRVALPIKTAQGIFTAHYSERGLAALEFPRRAERKPATPPAGTPSILREWHDLTSKAVQATLAGKTPSELPPLDVTCGTEFQQVVWEELLWIPGGETRSYGEIAKLINRAKASRAVGRACGANPIPLLIPCHRVLTADGGIGGFSGGLEWKRRLLAIEKVTAAD